MFSYAIATHVSSAYIFGVMYSKQFSKSLTYNKNSEGPKHEPCGIRNFKEELGEVKERAERKPRHEGKPIAEGKPLRE